MAQSFRDRLMHAWNAFRGRDHPYEYKDIGVGYGFRQDKLRLRPGNERSIINAICTRIAIDVASISVKHVRLDDNERYTETIVSGLNNVLTLEANLDQTARDFMQDVVMSLFDEGCVAVVPVDTTIDPAISGSYDIKTLRVGKITQWWPEHVQVYLYNDRTGLREYITIPKKTCAIVTNPLYSIMNEPNSILQRLIRKLNLLDAIDEQSGAGKLDLIIQLPYVIKSDARRAEAERRRKEIEEQLAGSKYGVAYTDGTERVIQLNRSLENNLLGQIEYLTKMLYSQLGMTEEVFNGTANETVMLNYWNRTVEPVLSAIVDEYKRKFLTKTARTQKESIIFFREPFRLVPVNNLADIADSFTRNEILTSNEVRGLIGFKPAADPNADMLMNKNMQHPFDEMGGDIYTNRMPDSGGSEIANTPEQSSQPQPQQEQQYYMQRTPVQTQQYYQEPMSYQQYYAPIDYAQYQDQQQFLQPQQAQSPPVEVSDSTLNNQQVIEQPRVILNKLPTAEEIQNEEELRRILENGQQTL